MTLNDGQKGQARRSRRKQEGNRPIHDSDGNRASGGASESSQSQQERIGRAICTGAVPSGAELEAKHQRLDPPTPGKTLRGLIEDCKDQILEAETNLQNAIQEANRRIERLRLRCEYYEGLLQDWEAAVGSLQLEDEARLQSEDEGEQEQR
ncbi:hypothetical protein [Leptolyngbya sp. FACHB-261]|uniref:hypothetical protein n=1 Tax=Leptolyngbya sp. FACHB-261 TaxID=2692806 RepID=UPI00168A0EC8|nr:hypothetical protein [Leptolyngbya sp. FACHB-261]MBD2103655.1 hypothetical protein [Leptolyngbya sp. FACHB-261]